MHVKDADTHVSLDDALEHLNRAKALLKVSKDKNEEWRSPLELLDTTAAALDDAGLALRSAALEEEENKEKYRDEDPLVRELRRLPIIEVEETAESVRDKREAILHSIREKSIDIMNIGSGEMLAGDKQGNFLIVWATHTGTAKKFAQLLQGNLSGAQVVNIKDLNLSDLQKRRVLFVCSTFGCGRPPRDAEVLFSTVQVLAGKKEEDNSAGAVLSGVEFAVGGLGDSKFNAFCKFARELSVQLQELGAKELFPVATFDANNGKAHQQRSFMEWQNVILELEGKPPISIEGPSDAAESICCSIL